MFTWVLCKQNHNYSTAVIVFPIFWCYHISLNLLNICHLFQQENSDFLRKVDCNREKKLLLWYKLQSYANIILQPFSNFLYFSQSWVACMQPSSIASVDHKVILFCAIKASAVQHPSIPLIDAQSTSQPTLNQYSVDTRSTLVWHSIDILIDTQNSVDTMLIVSGRDRHWTVDIHMICHF